MNKILYTFLLIVLCSSCGSQISSSNSSKFDTLYNPKYANHFVVLQKDDNVVLRVKNPWQGAQNIQYDYSFASAPQRVITMSTSHSALLSAIGSKSSIIGLSSPQYLWDSELQKLPDVGYDSGLNYETIVGLKSDAYFTYELSGENSASAQKLRSLGINVVYIADYLENTPLAKAEWVVAFGAMMSKLEHSKDIFNDIESRYLDTKQTIAQHLRDSWERAPRVMLNSPYKDVWYLPGDSSYMVEMLRDAGADYVGKGVSNNVSRAVSMESAYAMLSSADVWVNLAADITTLQDVEKINNLMRNVKIPIFNNTLRNNSSGGSDFWESGVLRCDLILLDLATIFYPNLRLDHKLYYYTEIQ